MFLALFILGLVPSVKVAICSADHQCNVQLTRPAKADEPITFTRCDGSAVTYIIHAGEKSISVQDSDVDVSVTFRGKLTAVTGSCACP